MLCGEKDDNMSFYFYFIFLYKFLFFSYIQIYDITNNNLLI